MENKRKVLVIGLDGQLGHSMFDHVGIFKHPDANIEWTFTTHKELDISEDESVLEFFNQHGRFDYVVNCAAYTNVTKAETENGFLRAIDTNMHGVRLIAQWCKNQGVKYIHISTDYVYDGTDKTIKNENAKLRQTNCYAMTKYMGELYISKLSELQSMIFRISTLYSEYGKNIVKLFIDSLRNNKPIDAIDDNMFNITNATEMARFIVDEIIVPDKFVPGTYNYGNAGWTTTHELALKIAKIIGSDKSLITPIKTVNYKSSVERPQFTAMDFSKIEKVYGPMKNCSDELTRFVKFYNSLNC